MLRSIGSPEQTTLRTVLREVRVEAGVRQSDLARRLGQPQSFVSKYEAGERRIDLIETREICRALGMDLGEFVSRLERRLEDLASREAEQ